MWLRLHVLCKLNNAVRQKHECCRQFQMGKMQPTRLSIIFSAENNCGSSFSYLSLSVSQGF